MGNRRTELKKHHLGCEWRGLNTSRSREGTRAVSVLRVRVMEVVWMERRIQIWDWIIRVLVTFGRRE